VRCRTVWRAELSHADKLMAAAEALGPASAMAEAGSFAEEPPPMAEELPAENATMAVPDDFAAGEPGPVEAPSIAEEPPVAVDVEAPPLAPTDLDDGQPVAVEVTAEPAEAFEDIETYAARHDKRKGRFWLRWPLSNLQSVILALLVADAILVGWRDDFVRVFPQTASFYATLGLPVNLRGVTLDGVVTTTEQRDGVPILVVEGNIVNDARRIVDVPRLKFVVRNAAREEVYSWTAVPPRPSLPPGGTVTFRSRLASPPPDGRDVLVRFVTRRDIVSGPR
jgi:hypothetical protein